MKIKKRMAIIIIIIFLLCPMYTVSAEQTGSTVADITFLSGTLSLAKMSSFSFGTHTISSALQIYPARESKIFLNVFDLRGTGAGWKVTALASQFNPGDNPTLPGATISFLNGTATSAGTGGAPAVIQSIQLDCDGTSSASIVSAEVNSGLGSWSIEWNGTAENNANTTLTIPAGVATVGTHTANITWTLTNGP